MDKNIFRVAVAIAVSAGLILAGKSYFRRNDALKAVRAVLSYWEEDDPIPAMSYWEQETASPPIYDLLTYDINKKEFDKENGFYRARIYVTLYFPAGNRSPSGKEWLFALKKTPYGWKIVDFQLQE
jgi:hypothetical protein